MSLQRSAFISVIVLLATTFALTQATNGQQQKLTLQPPTRLVYHDAQSAFPQVCVALNADRRYSFWRTTPMGKAQSWEGTLPPDFKRLEQWVRDAGEGGPKHILRGLTRSFMLEIPEANGVERRSWVADEQNPFPDSVAKVVDWLQQVTPDKAEPRQISKRDVCPAPRNWPVPVPPTSAR